jgi:hypothetical protein
MLFGVQVLVAVSAPGSCRIPGAVYRGGHVLGGPSADVVDPRREEPGHLAPVVALNCVGFAIGVVSTGAVVLLGLISRRGDVEVPLLVAAQVGSARGTRMAWWQAFEALLEVGPGPGCGLVQTRCAIRWLRFIATIRRRR